MSRDMVRQQLLKALSAYAFKQDMDTQEAIQAIRSLVSEDNHVVDVLAGIMEQQRRDTVQKAAESGFNST